MAGPRILITNDDGFDAPGIKVLREVAAEISDDVWVVAPMGNQSGAGHRFTLGHELSFEQKAPQEFAVSGTPADCVVAGCTHFAGDSQVDLVLSGINNGQNLGDIIHCSGTAAGAREGALQGALGIALSQAVDYENAREVDWTNARTHAANVIGQILGHDHPRDTYFNVNFPFCATDQVKAPRLVPHQRFSRSPFKHYASKNEGKFFVTIPETPHPLTPGADFHTLHFEKAITITPLSLNHHDENQIERLKALWEK